MKKITLLLAIITIAFSSCKTLVNYSDTLQKERGWTNEQLKHAQFYLSNEICLERKLSKEFPDKIAGKIVIKNGVKKEVIYLPKKLRIAFVDTTQSGAYLMRCEVGDGNTLTFGVNPNDNGRFVLLASDWDNGFGRVHYNGVEYFVSTDKATTHLLIDLRKHTKEHNSFHKAGGVKVTKQS